MFRFLRRFVPPRLISGYHRGLAAAANFWYGRPSRHLIVIGVTGTDGKTTTAILIAGLLAAGGKRVGLSSSVYYQVGERRWLNTGHMTMPGRFGLQRLLRQMVRAGCQYAIVEVSSEGLAQYRHSGIDFDAAVITNLSPEHIKAHGSFERYRRAKELLFSQIIKGGDKRDDDGRAVKKVIVVNLDDPSAEHFLKFWAEEYHGVTAQPVLPPPLPQPEKTKVWRPTDVESDAAGSSFSIAGYRFRLPLPGAYNVMNATEAIVTAHALGAEWPTLQAGLRRAQPIPGRWQEIPTGRPWRVIIDYALTPVALKLFYQALKQTGARRIIAVFGAAGGGRDTWKRPELGAIAAAQAAVIILTTDDPDDEDPAHIAGDILAGVSASMRSKAEVILDRRQAIRRAMELAGDGDVIALTGMGAERSMIVGGQAVPWNDAVAVSEEIKKL